MDLTKTIVFISRIIYPKYNPVWFILYMYFKYFTVYKRSNKYYAHITTDEVLWNIIRDHPKSYCDLNNCILIHPDNIYPSDNMLLLSHPDTNATRKVFIVPSVLCKKNWLHTTLTFFENEFIDTRQDFDLKLHKSMLPVQFAQEIELSLIASPYDISNAVVDTIIEGYFKLPKIVYRDDLISINIKYFAPAAFFTEPKVNCMKKVYFKCKKIIFQDIEVEGGYLCVIGKTSIKQGANIQRFVQRDSREGTRAVKRGHKSLSEVWLCPSGLEEYWEKIDRAIDPFIKEKNINLKPVFLIQGEEGCGDEVLLNLIAAQSAIQHYKINNSDLSANVYAHNESKLNNIFFTAKMSAPCLISIHKFHNFGRNNEGQYDQRIINSFIQCVSNLFENNPFPVILVCCTNSKDIPAELRRVFLEIFEINAPTDTERVEMLRWFLEKNDIELEGVDLKNIANKTHGFYFEDLRALVCYAENNFHRTRIGGADKIVLTDENFQYAVDFMQSSYNESLGAPKVPKVQWSDVGGLADVKEEIIKTINLPLKHPEIFKNSGLSRSGILLFGPPGTGKTLIAKAVATECSLCFLTVKGPELLNMYVGQSEQNVRQVFEKARQASPCIIFFDELDSLAPNRGLSGDSGGVMDRVVSQLLAEMDGLESSGKVFIIGATNRPDLIDPALLRPGRFDKLLYVGPCTDLESKASVLQALTRKFKLADDVNVEEIVETCPEKITGADFYGICSNAWSSAAKRLIGKMETEGLDFDKITHENVIVNNEDIKSAIKNVKPSISEADLKYFENLKNELCANVTGNDR